MIGLKKEIEHLKKLAPLNTTTPMATGDSMLLKYDSAGEPRQRRSSLCSRTTQRFSFFRRVRAPLHQSFQPATTRSARYEEPEAETAHATNRDRLVRSWS
jgi:hypothetical protein